MRSSWRIISVLYGLMGMTGAALSWWMNGFNPWLWEHPALQLRAPVREVASASVGLMFGAAVVAVSRLLVDRFPWAKELHRQLRSVTHGCSNGLLWWLAGLSALSEELVFRSWLGGWWGIGVQAAAFALLHQVPGKARWVWVSWALFVGLAFGGLFWMFGTLTGPVLAHLLINGLNLPYLRDKEV